MGWATFWAIFSQTPLVTLVNTLQAKSLQERPIAVVRLNKLTGACKDNEDNDVAAFWNSGEAEDDEDSEAAAASVTSDSNAEAGR
jgi:hypothetical protein